ncbi:MAG: hypothetical protein WCG25_00350 [bacterium]
MIGHKSKDNFFFLYVSIIINSLSFLNLFNKFIRFISSFVAGILMLFILYKF